MNIKNWYIKTYPHDELGFEIDPNATFEGLFDTLDYGADVYKFIGVCDSVVRERVFEKLAELMQVDYDYIYNQWLRI